MQLMECERLSLKATTLPCGDIERCFLPEPCEHVPNEKTYEDLKKNLGKTRQQGFCRFESRNRSNRKVESMESTMKEYRVMGRGRHRPLG